MAKSWKLARSGLQHAEGLIRDAARSAELRLSGLKLAALPESLRRLTQLDTLWLNGNELTELPDWIDELTHLTTLDLDHNLLTTLPSSIGGLTELGTLYLSGNQLTSLPTSMGRLRNLSTLFLMYNRLSELDRSLQNLNLQYLDLSGNDALGLPPEILGRSEKPGEILEYYFRARVASRPLNEAKLILVGRGGAGKTSLVNRLLFDRFDPREKRTDGISISEWILPLGDSSSARLNLWDFGGQEIMHATHQFFLTQRSLYLLVLEGRQGAEDADAEYWLKMIESFGTETTGEASPAIVVMNKIGDTPFDLNRRALAQKYPFIRGFVATDCSDRTGLAELRAGIERETDGLKHLRAAFPASWFTIKDSLAGMRAKMRRSFVSFAEYRALCAENGEPEPDAQESLAAHLHNLGIALNFRDDPRLRDTHVLDPHWVTNGIYKILNSAFLAAQSGEVRLSDAEAILDPKEYPQHMHRFLFDLMKRFQLCFTFPDDDTHYLIPELLGKQEPSEAAAFGEADCLNFEYRYPLLSEGLLPRFIVRTHSLSAGQPRWRTGVILSFEGSRAVVKADVQDKRVAVLVSGQGAGKRRLLAIVRSDLERIHSDVRLKPDAYVRVPEYPALSVSYAKLLAFENKGRKTFSESIGDDVIDLDVQRLLTGVDLEGARPRVDEARESPSVKVFYSYSHKDEALRDELETHLKLLQRVGLISEWHDRQIEAGDDWKTQIDEHLERADIVLLLVSADFIASDYCYEKEMKRALERHERGETRVIPVIVRDVNWKRAPFARLQALPKGAKAVQESPSRDAAWRNVSEGIERVAEEIRRRMPAPG